MHKKISKCLTLFVILTQTVKDLYTVNSNLAKQLFSIPFKLSETEYPIKLELLPPFSSTKIQDNFSLEAWIQFPDALREPKNFLAVRINEHRDFLFLLSFWENEDQLRQSANLIDYRRKLNLGDNSNWFLLNLDFEVGFSVLNRLMLTISIFINKNLVKKEELLFQNDSYFEISKVFATLGAHSISDPLCSW
jgi:hypothetical protein